MQCPQQVAKALRSGIVARDDTGFFRNRIQLRHQVRVQVARPP